MLPLRTIRTALVTAALAAAGVAAGGERAEAQQDGRLVSRLDSLLPGWLEEYRVPGVSVAVTRRDSVLLARGWGGDEAGGARAVTADTPFRVASLSKLVTATAALRLVEQGRLPLHEDIGQVLGADDIPRAFAGDVTLHHLLTHTAGFDLSDVGDATPEAQDVLPLGDLVALDPEPQVLPPGLAHHYSNFGFALVGHLVERAAERPFAEYVDAEIFQPLGMRRSTFRQPPPPAIGRDLSVGHACSDDHCRPLPLDFSHVAPADALVTTANDMASFLRFHLGARPPVLSRAMRDTMHATRFTASPSPYGMAYGFEENVLAGRRVLQHGGAQLGFASFLVLLPEDDLAVFIAQNAREGALRWAILDEVFDVLLEEVDGPAVRDPATPDPGLDPSPYVGAYRHTGYTHSTFEKAATVLGFRGGEERVEAGPESGTLLINGEVWRHARELGPHTFVNPDVGWWTKGFLVGEEGEATHHVAGREVLERLAWWERKRVVQLTLLLTTLLAVGTALGWPLARRIGRRPRPQEGEAPRTAEPEGARRGRSAVRWIALLWIVAIACFFAMMPVVMNRDIQFDYGPTWELYGALTLLLLASAGSLALPILAGLAWRRRWWTAPSRVLVSAYAILAVLSVAALHYMNLVGYRV